MHVQFLRDTLVGETVHAPGSRAEVVDQVGHRLIAAKAAVPAVALELADVEAAEPIVERAVAPPAPETASNDPGRRRKVS